MNNVEQVSSKNSFAEFRSTSFDNIIPVSKEEIRVSSAGYVFYKDQKYCKQSDLEFIFSVRSKALMDKIKSSVDMIICPQSVIKGSSSFIRGGQKFVFYSLSQATEIFEESKSKSKIKSHENNNSRSSA